MPRTSTGRQTGPAVPPPGADALRVGIDRAGRQSRGAAAVGLADARRGRRGGRQRQDLDGQGGGRGGGPPRRPGPGDRPAGGPRPVPPPGTRAAGLSAEERALRREFLDRVEPRIWTPGSSHGRRLSLDPIRLAGRDELARIADPDRRRGGMGGDAGRRRGAARGPGQGRRRDRLAADVPAPGAPVPGGRRRRPGRGPRHDRRRGLRPRRPSAWTTRTSSSRSRSARSSPASSTACGSARPRASSPAASGSTSTRCAGPTRRARRP